jgi:hypothetical protein
LNPQPQSDCGLVLPWFVSTTNFVALWTLLVLLLSSGIVMMFVRVPVYSRGVGVVSEQPQPSLAGGGAPVIITFFPANMISVLAAGQTLSFEFNSAYLIRGSISEVRPKPFDRAEAAREFSLSDEARARIPEQSVVAIVELKPDAPYTSHSSMNGRILRANSLLSTRRIGSFFPVIGDFFLDSKARH